MRQRESTARETPGPDTGAAMDCPVTPASAQQTCSSTTTTRTSLRPARQRATSYYNSFQTSCSPSTDAPPSYPVAVRTRPRVARSLTEGSEPLPSYVCTIAAECKLLLNLESVNPLSPAGESEWREVYLVLRGTLLSLHRPKNGGPGKLLRAYTLQHAEVGLATDSQHTILLPQSRLANLIPSAARRRAWLRDPDLFTPVRQSLLRLRVETDQILLADSDEGRIHSLIHSLSAAIDISQALDERSIPKQCTVPRRRRRPRQHFNGDLTDPALLAEQERIMRQMYPGLTGVLEDHPQARPQTAPAIVPVYAPSTPSREEEEIDFSMMREDSATGNTVRPGPNDGIVRPSAVRQTTGTTIGSTFSEDMIYATPMTNFADNGKWQPPHHRSVAQVQRYIKRCMPILHANASRASDIVVLNGRRMKINWRMELLEDWELQPPSYQAHSFANFEGVARSNSQRSTSASANLAVASEDDSITQAGQILDNLQLSKIMSAASVARLDPKSASKQPIGQEPHGVVFCF